MEENVLKSDACLQVSMFPGAVPMIEVEKNLDKYKDLELIPYWYRIISVSSTLVPVP